MPFDGSGNFNRLYSWVTDALAGLFINATKMDAEMNGFATGLSDCVTRDGQSPPTANLPMNGKKLTGLSVGSAATDSASIADITSRVVVAEWQAFSGATLSFLSATTFKTIGLDTTSTFVRGRRLKVTVTAGTTYCNVSASTFAAGDTTITVTGLRPFNLDAGISAVSYGLISGNPSAVPMTSHALFASSGDQAVTLNTDTQLTALVASVDTCGETSGATFTPIETGYYLVQARLASVALGPAGFFYISGGILTDCIGLQSTNYGGAAEYGGFFCTDGAFVVKMVSGTTYNFRVVIAANTTFKATYTQVTVSRLA